jgi:hypothetical protein
VAAVLQLVHPAPNLEFPLAHLVNFGIYCAALGTFAFLLRQIVAAQRDVHAASPAYIGPPEWAWIAIGYAAFIWCTLQYTPLLIDARPARVGAGVRHAGLSGEATAAAAPHSVLLGGLLGMGHRPKRRCWPGGGTFLVASALLR